MKIEFYQNETMIWFEMKPETVIESNQLLRFAANASAKKPDVYYSFRNIEPVLVIVSAAFNPILCSVIYAFIQLSISI